MKRLVPAAIFLLLLAVQAGAQTPAQQEFFETRIRPVLAQQCYGCHADAKMGGLRIDSKEELMKGGRTGPAVVAGDPENSLLIAAIRHTGDLKMPKGGDRLTEVQISDLVAWVKDGAYWPADQISSAGRDEFFESRIRPVFAQQCFVCHTGSKMGGLRLDSRDDILKGGKSGPAIVPGDPDKSLLLAAVRHSGELKMPKGSPRLTDAQIADLSLWVKDGAYWPAEQATTVKFTDEQRNIWSIQPLRRPEPPKIKDTAWPLTDIDRFVLAKLEKEGLRPAPLADRRTLLRRVTYDLTGLPPTFEEVKTFEADTSPNAFEKVIDRLLASPRYGEKWARHWMDVVRYGEDDYRVAARPDRAEKYPFAYLYRDWLIRALNDDMSYDLFVKAQLAGDLLDEKIRPQMIPALGMHGNGIWIFHASPAPVERADEWHDKVDVTTKAFLGLTVGCARCHDHKYDAIPTRDYYSLVSVFASSRFKAYPRVPKSVSDAYDKQKKELEKKEADLKKFLEKASELYAQMLFLRTEDYMVAAWRLATQKRAIAQSIADEYRLDAELLERWARFLKKKPYNYPFLKSWQELVAKEIPTGEEPKRLEEVKKLARAFYLKVTEVNEKYLKLKEENEISLAQFKKAEEEQFDPLPNGLKRKLNNYQIDLKGLDREDTLLWRDVFETDLPELPGGNMGEEERKPGLLKLTDWALEKRLTADLSAHVARVKADIEAFKKAMPPQFPFVYGIEEAKEPSDLKVFVRGNPYTFGENAPRAFPSIFSEGEPIRFDKGSGRLQLAEEIVKQPITARVIVNRIWRWHMGRGISDTPSNFGMVGERPTNPDLLEYLASQFVEGGMSWKKLHKEILMSRTYQLSADTVEPNLPKDADNRFFWRANRQRLDSEGVWDALLAASGKLDLNGIGGPSEDLTDKMVRRAVYAKVSRMYPNDFQATFDLPTATISTERRYTTNVPQQRLFFLNNSFVEKQADALAERVRFAGSKESQVSKAFEIVYQRAPSAEEMKASLAFLPDDASSLKSFSWTLLSSNEFLFID